MAWTQFAYQGSSPSLSEACLLNSNGLDLDIDTLRQLAHGNTSSGRLMCEPFLVFAVHLSEMFHVGEEDLHQVNARIRRHRVGILTPTLTIFPTSLPAASKIALMFLQHCSVFSAIEPDTSFPLASAGICPATQTCPAALMA